MAFTFKCGWCNVVTTELWSVFHGLKAAMRLGYNKVLIETDLSQVYNFLTKKDEESWANHNLSTQCRVLYEDNTSEFKVRLIRRQANSVADTVAKWALTFPDSLANHTDLPLAIKDWMYTNNSFSLLAPT